MQQMDLIINQIIVLVILGLIGYLSGKTGYLPQKSATYISGIVIKITAPSLIITTLAAYDFTAKTITEGMWTGFFAFVFVIFSLAVGSAVSRFLKLEGAAANIYRTHSMFGNVSYLALPLLKAIFGEKGLVYGVFFVVVHDTLIWTIGVYLMNKHHGREWKENLKHLINSSTIAYALGVLFALINLQHFVREYEFVRVIYTTLFNALNPLGSATLYLIMLFIGLTLAENRIAGLSDVLKKYPTFVLSFFKLIAVPVAALLLLNLLGGLVDPFVKTIVVVELAMPCGMIITALAAEYGSDYKLATDNVIITTMLSMFTLPLILFLV